MKKYELLLVLPGTLDEKESEAKANEILALVKENSTAAEIHLLGKNRLAYAIRQIRYGYFYTIVFEADPAGLKALHDKTALLREPLRVMISHFNTTLTAAQKIVYSTDEAGVTTMVREKEYAAAPQRVSPAAAPSITIPELAPENIPAKSNAERKIDDINIDEINKKLDDLMKGDVIPGV
jgi:ribosomal protein S6